MLFLLFSLGQTTGVWANPAEANTHAGAAHKINLAGRQRMLTQRMTAATCLNLSGGDALYERVARDAHDEFNSVLNGFLNGDPALRLAAETEPSVRAAFAAVAAEWTVLGVALQQILAGDLHTVVLSQMVQSNVPALTKSNAAVQALVAVNDNAPDADPMAQTVNVAGRQRMLSQKMMKELCFVVIGLGADAAMEDLRVTMGSFDAALANLLSGDAGTGLVAPPTPKLRAQLRKVEGLWLRYKEAIEATLTAASAETLPRPELDHAAALSSKVLVEMHAAVLLYVEYAKS